MASSAPFDLQIPTFTDDEIRETPTVVVLTRLWDIIATTIQSPTFEPVVLAKELDKLFPSNQTDEILRSQMLENCGGYLWMFWEVFAEAAGQIPMDHPGQQRLIEVITALRDLPNPVPTPVDHPWWGPNMLWSDLPVMGPALAEAREVDQGVNLEVFMIRITVAGLAHFGWLGISSLSKALEKRPEPRSTAYDKRGELLDDAMPRAALWIQLAGPKLYEAALTDESRDSPTIHVGWWKGPAGFSIPRWNLWKLRLLEICGENWTSRKTKDLAWDMMTYMNYIDGSFCP